MAKTAPKLLSQNFLWNRELVRKLIRESSISPGDHVLEIGAGKGIISEQLLGVCQKVTAVEADRKLFSALRRTFSASLNLSLHTGDFLDRPLPESAPFKVFSNIPFSITGEVVKKLLFSQNPPVDSYLVVQKEAAEKFVPTDRQNSMLAVLFFPWFEISIVHKFKREDFQPRPRVDSCLIKATKRKTPLVKLPSQSLFRDYVVYYFTRDRSATSLSPNEWLSRFGAFVVNRDHRVSNKIGGSFDKWQAEERKLTKIHRTRVDKNWKIL